MSLYATIEQRMKVDREALEKKLAAEYEAHSIQHHQEHADKERLVKTMIDDVIAEKVHLSTYAMKQEVYFSDIAQDGEVIEQAYLNVLPQLLSGETIKHHLKKFLSGVEPTTEVTISGKHSRELTDLVKSIGHSQVMSSDDATGLGTITYALPSRHAEFSLEDFLADIKKLTISHVSKFVRNNG